MTQYNFTTNIEKRMPTTGEVYFVDRMTSDYAVQHPFDVDAFIESVFQKYEQMAQEDAYARAMGWNKTREALRRQWDATLGCRNPRGNTVLYPNKNGEKHPALMEVWHKAGDYWRRGLRLGDVLPAVVPPCKITRTEESWIALFPKDMHLLEQQADQPEVCPAVFPQEPQEEAPTPSPLAQMQVELEALRSENARLQAERELHRQLHRSRPRRVSDGQRPDIDPENNHHHTDAPAQPATARRKPTGRRWLKPLAVAAASVVACIVIYETGLLIPMGLIGLATSGLVK